MPFIIDM